MKYLLIILCLFSFYFGYSQNSTGDCIGAIPVCQTVYVEDFSPNGAGNIDPEVNDISCIVDERNSAWYIFTIFQGGDLGFTITPENLNNDYDWCVYNITGLDCEKIHEDLSYIASCNSTGGIQGGKSCHGVTGADGSVPYSFQNFGCGNDPPHEFGGLCPLNALIPVETGETYVMLVDNWSESEFGYTLAFDKGTAIILDKTELKIKNVELVGDLDCDWRGAVVTFNERIKCSETQIENIFVLNSKNEKIDIGLTIQCKDITNGYTEEVELIFTKPINQNDDYTLIIEEAVFDLCDNVNADFELKVSLNVIQPNVYIPNAFTPNEDGVNDRFEVYANEKVDNINSFELYSRWGDKVFTFYGDSATTSLEWDGLFKGKKINPSTYSYIIQFTDINGKLINQYGTVTIMK